MRSADRGNVTAALLACLAGGLGCTGPEDPSNEMVVEYRGNGDYRDPGLLSATIEAGRLITLAGRDFQADVGSPRSQPFRIPDRGSLHVNTVLRAGPDTLGALSVDIALQPGTRYLLFVWAGKGGPGWPLCVAKPIGAALAVGQHEAADSMYIYWAREPLRGNPPPC